MWWFYFSLGEQRQVFIWSFPVVNEISGCPELGQGDNSLQEGTFEDNINIVIAVVVSQ